MKKSGYLFLVLIIAVSALLTACGTAPLKTGTDIELSYDDGDTQDYACAGEGQGYLIDFTPSATQFVVKKVVVLGGVWGEPGAQTFDIEIYDKNLKLQYTATHPITMFTVDQPNWTELAIPDIKTEGKFYVFLYTGTAKEKGIHIGTDEGDNYGHTAKAVRSGNTIAETSEWDYSGWLVDKSQVIWMIRVDGAPVTN
jgi:predicted small secreted protein